MCIPTKPPAISQPLFKELLQRQGDGDVIIRVHMAVRWHCSIKSEHCSFAACILTVPGNVYVASLLYNFRGYALFNSSQSLRAARGDSVVIKGIHFALKAEEKGFHGSVSSPLRKEQWKH